ISHSYFRSDPFENEFSSFLKQLLSDPALTDKIIEKRTDTSLFFFQGTYNKYNPFFFKPKKVVVVLTEIPVELDSLKTDTIYSYQLLAYNNDSKEGIEEVKKEFEKIYRRYKGSFKNTSHSENLSGNGLPSVTYNFFDPYYAVAPFAISWAGPNADKEICLILTIRMNTKDNKATLPVPLYTF
ncbi:MAG TPA: hypothetical protein VIZ28_05050, partial [Chitinophagaceae bacterium]